MASQKREVISCYLYVSVFVVFCAISFVKPGDGPYGHFYNDFE